MQHAWEKENAYKILVKGSEVKRLLESGMCPFENNIECYLQEIHIMLGCQLKTCSWARANIASSNERRRIA